MKANRDVVRAFLQGKKASGSNLTTDGQHLWSYRWWEIASLIDGTLTVREGPSFSQSTTRHRSLLRSELAWGRVGIARLVRGSAYTPASVGYMREVEITQGMTGKVR